MGNCHPIIYNKQAPFIDFSFIGDTEPFITISHVSRESEMYCHINGVDSKGTFWSYSEKSEKDMIVFMKYLIETRKKMYSIESITLEVNSNIGFTKVMYPDIDDLGLLLEKYVSFLRNMTSVI